MFQLGETAVFSIYHVVDLKPGEECLMTDEDSSVDTERELHGLFRYSSNMVGLGTPLSHASMCQLPKSQEHDPTHKVKSKESAAMESIMAALTTTSISQALPANPVLGDVASVIRSKAAGPYEITFDILFASREIYHIMRGSGALDAGNVANALGFKKEELVWCGFFEPANAFKVTVPRIKKGQKVPAGGFMENDVHGAQKYLPLGKMQLAEETIKQIRQVWKS